MSSEIKRSADARARRTALPGSENGHTAPLSRTLVSTTTLERFSVKLSHQFIEFFGSSYRLHVFSKLFERVDRSRGAGAAHQFIFFGGDKRANDCTVALDDDTLAIQIA